MTDSSPFPLERFELTAPLDDAQIDALVVKAPFAPLPEIRQLYSTCNGGYYDLLNLRILPLAEALRIAGIFADMFPTMRYWPFLVCDSAASDPCCISCDGPAARYVVHLFHDGDDSLKARSLQGFFAEIANVPSDDWWLEDDDLEFRNDLRNSDDLNSARSLLDVVFPVAKRTVNGIFCIIPRTVALVR